MSGEGMVLVVCVCVHVCACVCVCCESSLEVRVLSGCWEEFCFFYEDEQLWRDEKCGLCERVCVNV